MTSVNCTCSCGHKHSRPAPTCGSTTSMGADKTLRCEEPVGHGGIWHYAQQLAWTDEEAVLYAKQRPW
jgi:hypothetical protein